MALSYTSAIAALLNNGSNQVLPISMANLIELSKDKQNFGTGAQSVQDALSYLAGSFEHANTAAQTAETNAKKYTDEKIGGLDVAYVGSDTDKDHNKFISYIYQENGYIHATAQEMTAANVAYSGTGRATVQAELEHINTTIAKNLTDTTLKLVKTGSEGTDVTAETVSADGTEYRLKQGDKVVAKFNIEKDSFVKNGAVVRGTDDGHGNITEGDTGKYYIKLEIRTNDEGGDAERILYIPAESLVDAYSASNSDSDGNINSVKVKVDSGKNTISAVIREGGVGTNELAANAVTTAKIADKNVTKVKLADDVQTSLGKADTALQQSDITTGSVAGAISVKGTSVAVNGLAKVATSGKAENVSVATIAELDLLANFGADKHVDDVQEALATLAGKVKAINEGTVTSVKTNVVDNGKDTQDAVKITMTPASGEKGDVTVQLTHNLGSAAVLDYDATTSATPVSQAFWDALNK